MEAVVERLRESKSRFEKSEAAAGYDEGSRWATERAEYGQLLALWDWDPNTCWNEGDERLAVAMDRVAGSVRPDSIFSLFWEQGRHPSDVWARTFYRGAVAVWVKVGSDL